jgi:hypothetical protein
MVLIRTNYSTFSIYEVQGADAEADFLLEEFYDSVTGKTYVQVTVNVDRKVSAGDISQIGFDVLGDQISGISVTGDPTVITGTTKSANRINLGGNDKFDVGVQIGGSGSNDITLNDAVTFQLNGVTLEQLLGQRFGVRLQSVGGIGSNQTSRLVGTASGGSIGDLVWKDLNNNGTFDGANESLAGVKLDLYLDNGNGSLDASDTLVATQLTKADGSYKFIGLGSGTYFVDVVDSTVPTGLSLKSGPDPYKVLLSANQNFTAADFVYQQQPTGQAKLTVSLGYDFSNPNLSQRIYDPNGNGALSNVAFLVPELGQFVQTVTIANMGTASAAAGQTITIGATNNPFVKLRSINGGGINVVDGGAGDLDGLVNQSISFALPSTINQGSQLVFNTVSEVVPGITRQAYTYQLQDDPSNPNDFGNATASGFFYLSADGFNKTAGSSVFSFDPFADSVLGVDLDGDGIFDVSQALEVARGKGTIIEGAGGKTPGSIHDQFFFSLQGNADTWLTGRGGIYSDPILDALLTLTWYNPSSIDIVPFTNNSGASAFENSNSINGDSFLELAQLGLFSELWATDSIKGVESGLTGTTLSGVSIDQTANTGNFANPTFTNFKTVEFPGDPVYSGTFEAFVQSLDPSFIYRINITTANVLPVVWSNYSGTKVAAIGLPAGETTLRINNATAQDVLDLSNVQIFAVGSNFPTGATIDGSLANTGTNNNDTVIGSPGNDRVTGTNGKDLIDGWIGNDTLTGGNGSDTFRFSNPGGSYTFGNDRITDFGRNDTIDLSSFDLQYNQISQSVVGTGASRFLLIDLTNIAGGGTITLTGVTSALGESSFIL